MSPESDWDGESPFDGIVLVLSIRDMTYGAALESYRIIVGRSQLRPGWQAQTGTYRIANVPGSEVRAHLEVIGMSRARPAAEKP